MLHRYFKNKIETVGRRTNLTTFIKLSTSDVDSLNVAVAMLIARTAKEMIIK